jgi:adenine-specific DNA-methyltransferase
MEAQGYRVLRFWNNEVLTQTDAVRERILQALQEDNPHPNPLPQAGEGVRQDTRNLKP